MTLAQSASLTPEQLRVAVAERMGWTCHGHSIELKYEAIMCWTPMGREWQPMNCVMLPDYPNDLNACATFEATLTEDQQDEYAHHLSQVIPQRLNCGPVTDDGPDIMVHREFDLLTATATQRCRAFLAVTSEVTENRNE